MDPVQPTLVRGDRGARVRALQERLAALGHLKKAEVDGDFGPLTAAAVTAFQRAAGLVADGVVGPLTAAALNRLGLPAGGAPPDAAQPGGPDDLPDWCHGLRKLIGTREIVGRVNSDVIMGFSRKVATRFPGLNWAVSIFTSDEVPHCGAGVAYSLAEVGIMPPKSYPSALSYASWGQKLSGPALGAIAVKTRRGGGHVFFVAGRDGGFVAGLGSNQSNMVKISPFREDDVTAWRWPPGRPLPPAGKIGLKNLPRVTADGRVGQSEA